MDKAPFSDFGKQLKDMRQKAKESIADVSGAVEVDTSELVAIEAGNSAPSYFSLCLKRR